MSRNQNRSIQLFLAQFIAVFIWFLITVVQWSNNPKSNPGITIPLIVRGIEAISVLIASSGLLLLMNKARFQIKPLPARIFLLLLIYLFAIAANAVSLTIRRLVGFSPPRIDNYLFIQSLHFTYPCYWFLLLITW